MPAVTGEIFQITNFEKLWHTRMRLFLPPNIYAYQHKTERATNTMVTTETQEGTVQNTAYILIQSHNAEVGIFYRKFGIWYKYRYILTWLEKIFEGDIYVSSRKLKKQFSRSDENLERPQDDQFHWGRKGLYVSSVWKFCILYLYRRITSTGWKQLT